MKTKKTKTLHFKKSMGRSPLRLALLLIPLVFACFALSPAAQALVPAPDGNYPNGNTAEGDSALSSLTIDAPSTYEPYSFTTLAGLPPGSADGTGSAARFNSPGGVAVDNAGNTYVADTVNSTIRKITPGGVVTTFAGLAGSTGSANGTGSTARFNSPVAVAIDSVGNIFVADTNNSTIRKITPARVVSTFAGLAGSTGSANGTGSTARFNFPSALAVDSTNNIYVADTGNSTIRKITPARVVSTLAGLAGSPGSANGTGSAARFNFPGGVAVDHAVTGNIYVGDTSNFTIRQITPAGVVTTLAGSPGLRGGTNGTGSAARFLLPAGMAVDSAGNIYVADADACTIRKIAPGAVVSTFAGSFSKGGSQNGTGSAARFNIPGDVAVDSSNNLYVADSNNCTIRKISPAAVVTTVAGLASPGHTNGTGSAARFDFPQGVAVDTTGKIYVTDPVESAIRKITPSAVVSTFAGSPGTSGYVDATGTAARFRFPRLGLTVGAFNNVYVGDTFNFVVRKITPNAVVTSVITNPANGAGEVRGVAIDSSGNIYTADYPHHTIRKITPDGTASIFAGLNDTPGSANGIGSAARFNFPLGLAVDGAGNVYVADSGNNRIRKITPAAGVTTFAGSAVGSGDGTGTAARFNFPSGLAVDHSGNVFVTDAGNNTIRKITPARVVTTLGGLALSPGTSDGAGINARFSSPRGIAVDSVGNIYVADTSNHTIRVGTP
jgi:sugar lactone lactonase YvrE